MTTFESPAVLRRKKGRSSNSRVSSDLRRGFFSRSEKAMVTENNASQPDPILSSSGPSYRRASFGDSPKNKRSEQGGETEEDGEEGAEETDASEDRHRHTSDPTNPTMPLRKSSLRNSHVTAFQRQPRRTARTLPILLDLIQKVSFESNSLFADL